MTVIPDSGGPKATNSAVCLAFVSVQVSNYDSNTGLPLVHLWNIVGNEVRQQTDLILV